MNTLRPSLFRSGRSLALTALVTTMAGLPASALANGPAATLIRAKGEGGDLFGAAVSAQGDTAVFGAWGAGDSEGGAFVSTRSASGWSAPIRLVAPVEPGDDFGWSVAVSGDSIVVGSRLASEPEEAEEPLTETGAVTFFVRTQTGWSARQQVFSSGRHEGAAFGFSVDMLGQTTLVGEPGASERQRGNAGAAYIYTRNSNGTWTERQRLVLPNPIAGDVFGTRVALAQVNGRTYAFVASPGRDDKGNAAGAVVVFEQSSANSNYVYRQTLVANDGKAGDQFGFSLDAQNGRLVVGAPGVDLGSAEDAGAAYVFELSASGTWTQRSKLSAGAGRKRDLFGAVVAMDGDRVAVGRNPDASQANAVEEVSLFEGQSASQYSLVGSFQAPNVAGKDSFASAITLVGSSLLVGMDKGPGTGGAATGSVLVYDTEALPAPLGGSLSLAGLGLGFVALRRRRRR